MTHPVKIAFLLVEDSSLDAEVFRRSMRRHELEHPLEVRKTATDALAFLQAKAEAGSHEQFIIFLDLNIPGISGHDLLAEIRADQRIAGSIIFILTSSDHERDVRMAYEKNVAGYFTKGNIDDLMRAIKPFSASVLPPPRLQATH